jgi:hypothetical protein
MWMLDITSGLDAGVSLPVADGMVLGRDAKCDFVLRDPQASRRHVSVHIITATGGASESDQVLEVVDLGSRNGTYRAIGQPLHGTGQFVSGDEFIIGQTIFRCVFDLGHAEVLPQSRADLSAVLLGNDRYIAVIQALALGATQVADEAALWELFENAVADHIEDERWVLFVPAAQSAQQQQGDWQPRRPQQVQARFGALPFAKTVTQHADFGVESLRFADRSAATPSASMLTAGIRSAVAAPVRAGEAVAAVLYVDRFGDQMAHSTRDQALIQACADMVGTRLAALQHQQRSGILVRQLQAEVAAAADASPWPTDLEELEHHWQAVMAASGHILLQAPIGSEFDSLLRHPSQRQAGQGLQWVDAESGSEAALQARIFGTGSGQPGALELAHNGWFVLVGPEDLSPQLQQHLASVVASGALVLADGSQRQLSVRLILWQRAEGAQLVDDLFRLATHQLQVPSLAQRLQAHGTLLDECLAMVASRLGRDLTRLPRLDARARAQLTHHAWPGDMHELQRVFERCLVAVHGTTITAADLGLIGSEASASLAQSPPNQLAAVPLVPLVEMERRHILGVLEALGGNKKATAETLGIDRSTLYAKLRSYAADGSA